MDIDSFHTALENCDILKNESGRNIIFTSANKNTDHDSLSVSTDCDSFTADSNSLCDFSMSTFSEGKALENKNLTEKKELIVKVNCNINNCDKYVSDISFRKSEDNSSKFHINCEKHPSFKNDPNNKIVSNIVNIENASCEPNCKTKSTHYINKSEYLNISCTEKNLKTHQNSTLYGENFKFDSSQNKIVQEFIDDALYIFKKYIALEAPEAINCPSDIRKEVIENICDVEKVVSSNCFRKVQKYIYDILNKDYFEGFLGSDYYCKFQIDILTSGKVVLEDILYNETALFYFMEFLEQEHCRPLLDFWVAATNFQQQLHDQKEFFDPIEAQTDAVVLYDKYFSLQAHCPLGFGNKIRFIVEQNICGESGLVPDCFNLPLKLVEQVLEKNYLKSFLASELFYKYLSELIHTVQYNYYPTTYEKKLCIASDCSSEISFTTNNTFLALEMPALKSKKNEKKTDMNIDMRQLYDPDALWKRKRHHRLSFGRVTEFGRFETDVEPEPDKKSESKFKNVMRKIVNIEENKHKEEMAWQVAEMIVRDITNITLNEVKSNDS